MPNEKILDFNLTAEEAEKMILELKRLESAHVEQESGPKDQPIRFRVILQATTVGVTVPAEEEPLPKDLLEVAKRRQQHTP